MSNKRVDYKKSPYRVQKFENKGSFYIENFNIESWYAALPTKCSRLGISADSLMQKDALTVKEYLIVTCRGELCSVVNCFYIVCAAILDAPYIAFILGMLVVLMNLPFIAVNRYCRCLILNELIRKRRELEKQSILAERSPNVFDLNLF